MTYIIVRRIIIKNLSHEEFETLWKEFEKSIKLIALKVMRNIPGDVIQLNDLIHVGVMGLCEAYVKYKLERNNTFKTYAEFRIKGAMLDELRSFDWAGKLTRDQQKTIAQAEQKLEHDLGRIPNNDEVADLIGIDYAKLEKWRVDVHRAQLVSLEEFTNNFFATKKYLTNAVGGVSTDQAYHDVYGIELKRLFTTAIDELPHQQKVIVSLYYYKELTMEEISKMLKVTVSHVSRVHTEAIRNLKQLLADFYQKSINQDFFTIQTETPVLHESNSKVKALNSQSTAPKKRKKWEITDTITQRIIALRTDHPLLGKEKLHIILLQEGYQESPSTIGRILTKIKNHDNNPMLN